MDVLLSFPEEGGEIGGGDVGDVVVWVVLIKRKSGREEMGRGEMRTGRQPKRKWLTFLLMPLLLLKAMDLERMN